jgi:hypothetical protein
MAQKCRRVRGGNYPSKKSEMLEAGVEMSFFLEIYDFLKMRVIDMRIYPE